MRGLCVWDHLQIRAGLTWMFAVLDGSMWHLADTVRVYSLQRLDVPGLSWTVWRWADSGCGLCV